MITGIVTHNDGDSREEMLVREEIVLTQRYLDGISPKLQKYKELVEKKVGLQKRLKEIKKNAKAKNHKM